MLVDIHGKPIRDRASTSLHAAAENYEKGSTVAYGVIQVAADGTVTCDIGRGEKDGASLLKLAQGCGTIVSFLRAEYARHFAPDPGGVS